jgi:hypothetical protein
MHKILPRSLPTPLSPLLHSPGGYAHPIDHAAPPASLLGETQPPSIALALDRDRGRAPQAPPLLSAPLTERARTATPLYLACSQGEPTPTLMHPRLQSTPNPLWPRHSGHEPKPYTMLSPCPSRSCTRGRDHPSTPLVQPLPLPFPLQHRPHRRTPARRRYWTKRRVRLATSGHLHPSKNKGAAHAWPQPCNATACLANPCSGHHDHPCKLLESAPPIIKLHTPSPPHSFPIRLHNTPVPQPRTSAKISSSPSPGRARSRSVAARRTGEG